MSRTIKINLDPVTDGFADEACTKEGIDEHAFIIATNGKKKFISMDEAEEILNKLESKGESFIIGGGHYLVIFNSEKTFHLLTGKYFVGSMLIMAIDGDNLTLIPDEEADHVKELLERRMAKMVDGEKQFSALEIL